MVNHTNHDVIALFTEGQSARLGWGWGLALEDGEELVSESELGRVSGKGGHTHTSQFNHGGRTSMKIMESEARFIRSRL